MKFNKIFKKTFSEKLKNFGFITVPEGEKYLVYERSGKLTIKEGPSRFFNFFKKVTKMNIKIAGPSEYLYIKFTNGEENHIQGPTSIYFNPLQHVLIQAYSSTTICNNEALVVYQEIDSKIQRKIIYGPQQYFPQGKEWNHQFSWHGHDNNSPNIYRKVPRGLRFTLLRLIPDQMYFDVENIRTKDDALVTINTMVFYQLVDIEKMLDNSHDPIASFINNLSADIIDFMSNRTFEDFKKETDLLNQISTYKQLVNNSKIIGYNISKIVFRGYIVNQKLQEMHNEAIEKRTRLILTKESEVENQKLEDFKLEKMLEREAAKQKLELDKAMHVEKMKKISHEEEIRQIKESNLIKTQYNKTLNDIELEKLKSLLDLGVDLTKVIVSEKQTVEKILKIEDSGKTRKNIHI